MKRNPGGLRVTLPALLALLSMISGFPVAAQDDAPETSVAPAAREGRWAAGGDLGWLFAMDSGFDGSFLIDGFFEFRQSPQLSWRGMLMSTGVDGPEGKIDLLLLTGNVVYEWEANKVGPFVTAGIGAYRYDRPERGSATKFGMNVGGGVNIPVAGKLDVKVEAALHGVNSKSPDSFFLLSAGLRYRF